MKGSRAYRGKSVKRVDGESVVRGREGESGAGRRDASLGVGVATWERRERRTTSPFAPPRSIWRSFEGPGQTGSVKSPMQPIRRSSPQLKSTRQGLLRPVEQGCV